MAEGNDNKTEPATEKRKADARKDGNLAVSRDVTTAALLFAGIGLLALFAGPGIHQLTDITRVGLTRPFDRVVHASLTIQQLHSLVIEVGFTSVLLLLPFTHAIAPRLNGSRRWLVLGVSIQVSEVAKLVVVVWTAMLCAKKTKELTHLSKGLLPVLVVVVPLSLLVMVEPDLSTAVVIGLLAMIVLFAAGARIGHFILLGLIALYLAAAFVAWMSWYTMAGVSQRTVYRLRRYSASPWSCV